MISIAIIFLGCNDILDIEPTDRITGIWENAALTQAYVNGLYNSLQHGYSQSMWVI